MANIVDIIIKGKDQSKKALTAPIKNLKDLKTAARSLGPAFKLGVIVAVAALGALTKAAINNAEETAKMAQQLGISTEALSTMSFAARIAGSDTATLQKGMRRLSVQVLDAGRGLKEAQDNFAALGLEVRNTDGTLKTTEQLFKETADAISKLPNGLEKAALAQKIFGKSGAELIPLLNAGAAGIEAMQEQARGLGLEIDENTAKAAEEFVDQMEILNSAMKGAFQIISAELLPGLTALLEEFLGATDGPKKLGEGVQGVINVIAFLGKTALSVVESITTIFKVAGTAIATVMNAVFQLIIERDFTAFKQAVIDGFAEMATDIEGSAKVINKVWADSNKNRVKSSQDSNQDIVTDTKKTAAELAKIDAKRKRDAEVIERSKSAALTGIISNTFAAAKAAAGKNAKAQKVIATGEAIIQGALGVQKALGSTAPPLNFVLAAAVAAVAAANVATINSVGFQDGGIVPGIIGQTGDRVLAGLNPGEVILNAAQQDNLIGQLAGASAQPVGITIELDGQTLLSFMMDANQDGRFQVSAGSIV